MFILRIMNDCKLIVRITNTDEYLVAQRIALQLGAHHSMGRRPQDFQMQPLPFTYTERINQTEGFYFAIYRDLEIFWFIGGLKTADESYEDFGRFRAKYEKYLRGPKLQRILNHI